MKKTNITRTWGEFEAFLTENEESRNNRFAQQAVSLYNRRGVIDTQVKSKARMAGFEFEVETVEFSPEESRWIEIFNEMSALESCYADYARGDAGHDIFGAVSGRYTEDNSVAKKLTEINERLKVLAEERKALWEVEERLYPSVPGFPNKHIKNWL